MHLKGFFLFISLIISSYGSGQNIAVLYHQSNEDSELIREANKKILNHFSKAEGTYFVYKIDAEGTLHSLSHLNSEAIEKTCDYLLIYNFDLHADLHPDYHVKTDSRGGYMDAFFEIPTTFEVSVKLIDMSNKELVYINDNTSRITTNNVRKKWIHPHPNRPEQYKLFDIPIFTDHLTENPSKFKQTQPEEYQKHLGYLHNTYDSYIEEYYFQKTDAVAEEIAKLTKSIQFPYFAKAADVTIDNDRVQKIAVQLDEKGNIPHEKTARVYTLDTVQSNVYSKFLARYYVDKYHGDSLIFDKSMFTNAKDVAKAYRSGRPLYLSFQKGGYSMDIDRNDRFYQIGYDTEAFAVHPMEKKFCDVRQVNLLDNASAEIIDTFWSHYQEEKFNDRMIQYPAQEVHHMLVKKEKNYQIIQRDSGKAIYSFPIKNGFKGMYDAMMELYDLEIELIKPTKQNSRKVKKIQAYAPLGFWEYHIFDIFEIKHEQVDGKTRAYEVQIGKAKYYGKEGVYTGELKIKDGKKALKQALKNGNDIRFRNSSVHVPFIGDTKKF